ncbi:siphovirus ReqiPepy6 Gp37-like family protein [Bariatricus massiliensis]|uniref:Siphovirus ReqiPepy6 Gp37-like family protein n=1 Tax=Bariatricus massiliensis TaxID=1745713 RepID=A0ABS8DH79_9FIRM|nr:siphovirus ReqiPepy6 Gp37-like family protein [Bariatricus massiliensis]MCB7306192.1 siphovirus ReqiPepy6 Gp37-like family protein [Bariatricus massiliensis]MCB7375270.1 siphovirus ReqiPepy6 Gp37-like family protein [Bariatricus massiliensis]MCB7387730.1 siphovirus ReqiPepy6 Gp37-like family protein [Bariatricus massiliensis]MCB7411891.1 siphovirus ReqiPepy6 Gp37-like family protein [Bariatricus massiliensis]MCQ5254027.1 siphovirus ReqiPepy6 Gp37-like family protein [Bariatricus massiliensi
MDTRAVRFYSPDFRMLKEVDDAVVIFTKRWHSYGQFEIHLDRMEAYIKKDNRVLFDGDEYKNGIIKYIFEDTDGSVTIKGFTLLWLLKNRITVPDAGKDYVYYNAPVEDIMIDIVKTNAVTPVNGKRKLERFEAVESLGRGEKMAYQSSHTELTTCLEELSKYSMLGVAVRMDIRNKRYVFEVLEGTDRTIQQKERPPVVFREEYDNLSNTTYTVNDSNTKNCAYTAGQGEGADRAIYIVGDELSGERRREVYVDARDVEDASELPERGAAKLADMKLEENFESEVDSADYGKKWQLGDMVTIIHEESGLTLNDYVVEIEETMDRDGYSVIPTFGVPEKGLSSGSSSGAGFGGGGAGDARYIYTRSVPAEVWEINHNLGKFPSVTVTDSAGTMVMGDVVYIDRNNLKLIFIGGFAGFAYLN